MLFVEARPPFVKVGVPFVGIGTGETGVYFLMKLSEKVVGESVVEGLPLEEEDGELEGEKGAENVNGAVLPLPNPANPLVNINLA